MIANKFLLRMKFARIVQTYALKYNLPPEIALSHFYKSQLYQLISEGVSDLHCMSEDYLAEELHAEINTNNK